MAIQIPSRQLFIDGEWREPVLKKWIPIINPATEEIVGDIPAATAEDVEIAVDSARRAFSWNEGKYWASTSGPFRAKFLHAISSMILERKSELAKLEVVDTGKPLDEAASDMVLYINRTCRGFRCKAKSSCLYTSTIFQNL
ncbi:hypothetical protein ACB098_01G278400 [Castanea mollissima]